MEGASHAPRWRGTCLLIPSSCAEVTAWAVSFALWGLYNRALSYIASYSRSLVTGNLSASWRFLIPFNNWETSAAALSRVNLRLNLGLPATLLYSTASPNHCEGPSGKDVSHGAVQTPAVKTTKQVNQVLSKLSLISYQITTNSHSALENTGLGSGV